MKYDEKMMDLFKVSQDYYLAHCISADFAMGKGIAVQFNRRFDMKNRLMENYPRYLNWYREYNMSGDCILDGSVFNLITKERYFHKPTLASMRMALSQMRHICEEERVEKVAMPTIGAGLDRLAWNEVSSLIKEIFGDMDIEILVCRIS